MIRRVIGLLLVVVTAGSLVGVARNVPAEAARHRFVASLPVTPAAEVPICPGPETLQIPDGATAVPVPGAIALAGVVTSPTTLGRPSAADVPGGRVGGVLTAPTASLNPLGQGVKPSAAGITTPRASTPRASTPSASTPSASTPRASTPSASAAGASAAGAVAAPRRANVPAGRATAAKPAVRPAAVAKRVSPPATGSKPPAAVRKPPAAVSKAPAAVSKVPAVGNAPAVSRPAVGTAAAGVAAAGSTTPPGGPAVRVVQALPTQAGAWRLDASHVGEVPVVAAAQWTVGTGGDLRGLATTTCEPATTDTWLVGGGTQAGHRLRLLLANPGVSPSTVDVTLLGPQGVVQAPGGNGVVVAPGQQKALYLDALAPGLPALAVRVQARTGRVASTLHESVVRGLVAGGADDVPAAAPPARRQVIPGLSVVAAVAGADASAGSLPISPTAPGAVAVRVAEPGGTEAVVRVHLLGPDGEVNLPGGGVVTVAARGVAEIPVTGVADGVYAAVVEADTPVVAGAVIGRARAGSEAAGTPAAARGGVPPAELAWSAGGRALQATTAIALSGRSALTRPGSSVPTVAASLALAPLAAGTPGEVVLAEVAADGSVGAPRSVEIPAGRSVTVALAADSAGVLLRAESTAGQVVAALVLTGSDAAGPTISVQAVRPGSRTTGDTPVAVQDPRIGLHPPS